MFCTKQQNLSSYKVQVSKRARSWKFGGVLGIIPPRHGRHHQRALALPARVCYNGRPAHVGLMAQPAPVPTGRATIFVQRNFLYFLGCFQLGTLKMGHI